MNRIMTAVKTAGYRPLTFGDGSSTYSQGIAPKIGAKIRTV